MRDIRWHNAAEDEFATIVTYVMQSFGQNVALEVYEDIIPVLNYWLNSLNLALQNFDTNIKACR